MTVPITSQAVDAQGETLTVSAVTQGADGSVTINDNGTITYTPNSGFTGTDTFTYTVEDTSDNVASNYVTVTVSDSSLVAGNGTVTTLEDGPVTVTVMNDVTYSPGSTVTVTSVTQGANGTVVLNGDGTVTYTPNTGFYGTDSFTYTVENNSSVYATGTITVQVGAFDVVDTWGAFVATTPGTADNLNVLSDSADFPGNTLTLVSVTQGAHGTVTMNSNGAVTYTPNSGYCGPDSFTYTVEDELGNTSTATVGEFISITGVFKEAQLWELKSQIQFLDSARRLVENQTSNLYFNLIRPARMGKGPLAGNPILLAAAESLYSTLQSVSQTIFKKEQTSIAEFLKLKSLLLSQGYTLPAPLKNYKPPLP